MGDTEPYIMEINGDETPTFSDDQTSQTEVAVSEEAVMVACDGHLHDTAVSRINGVIPEEDRQAEEKETEETGEDSGKVDTDLENAGVSEVLLESGAVKSPLQQETLTTADDVPPSEESEKAGNSAASSESYAIRPISSTPDDNPHDNQEKTDENGVVTDDEAIAGENDKSAWTCNSDKTSSQNADESQKGTVIKDVVESGELDVNSSCGSGNDSEPLDIKAEVVSCCDTSFALPGTDKEGSMENIDSIAKDLTPDVENCADTFSAHVLAEGKNASDTSTLETASPERQAALISYDHNVDSPLSENLESGFVDMLSPTTDSERRTLSETFDQDLVTDGVGAFSPTVQSGDDSGLWIQNEDASPDYKAETNTGAVEFVGNEAVSNTNDAQLNSVVVPLETVDAERESSETTLDSGGAGSENLEAGLETGGAKSDLVEDYSDAKKDFRGTDEDNVRTTGALHLEAEKAEPATSTEQSLAASDSSAGPERQGTASSSSPSSSTTGQPLRGTVKGTPVGQGSSIAWSNVMSSVGRRRMDLILPQKATMEEDVAYLRQELHDKTRAVQRLQTTLFEQQARANLAVINLRTQLRQRDLQTRHVRQEHEQRMKALLTHLLYLEGQMRQEQKQVLQALQRKEETMQEKDDVIRRQRSAIADLASKNEKLLAALKEAHGYSGTNGLLSSASLPSSSSVLPPGSPGTGATPSPVVLRNKDKQKGQSKVIFGSVKDKLRRHRSSLELHRPASLETLLEGTLRYGSQENIAAPAPETPVSVRPAGKGAEGLSSDEVKKNRQLERKERCRSMVDYPSRLNDLPEVSSEVEKDQPHSDNGGGDEGFGSSSVVSSSSRNSDPTSVSSASFLSDPLYEQLRGGRSPASSLSSFSSPQHLPSSTPQGRDSLYSDEDEAFASSSPGGDDVCAGRGGCPADARDGTGKVRAAGELTKAASMPHALSSATALDHNGAHSPQPPKERPLSLPGMELNLMERMTMQPQVSMCPSPTSHAAPGGSESNPFKSIKNVFMRRNSKQRSKKRPVSVGQMSSGDQSHQQLQEHFRKYDLS